MGSLSGVSIRKIKIKSGKNSGWAAHRITLEVDIIESWKIITTLILFHILILAMHFRCR